MLNVSTPHGVDLNKSLHFRQIVDKVLPYELFFICILISVEQNSLEEYTTLKICVYYSFAQSWLLTMMIPSHKSGAFRLGIAHVKVIFFSLCLVKRAGLLAWQHPWKGSDLIGFWYLFLRYALCLRLFLGFVFLVFLLLSVALHADDNVDIILIIFFSCACTFVWGLNHDSHMAPDIFQTNM